MTTRIQLRRDTAANWTVNNPVLASAEIGVETDTGKFKIGNGSSTWTGLDYASGGIAGATAPITYDEETQTVAINYGTGLTTSSGTLTADFGTVSGKVVQGNDSRLSDARTPTAHKTTHAIGGSDTLSAADIGAATSGHNHSGTYELVGTVTSAISAHESASDPHPTYLTATEGNASYDALGSASAAVAAHAALSDPHPTYLTATEGNAAYDALGSAAAAVAAHSALSDPHPTYLTATEGNAAYDALGSASAAVAAHAALSDPHPTYLTATEGNAAYDSLGTASSVVSAHTLASDPHGDRANAASTYIPLTAIGTTVASLSGGKIPTNQLPAIAITDAFVVSSQSAMLALTAETGDIAIRTDLNKSFILSTNSPSTLADWKELLTPTDAVLSVDGRTGAVTLSDLYDASGTASSLVTAHGTTTTNVHGITNTANLLTTSSSAGGDLTGTFGTLSIGTGKVTSAHILDGTIVDEDISTTAAIAASKISGTAATLAGTETLSNKTLVNANLGTPSLITFNGTNTAGTIANSATSATSLANAYTIVLRDGSGGINATGINAYLEASYLTGDTLPSSINKSSLTSFGTSPTFITPNIGAGTGTSLSVSSNILTTAGSIATSTGTVSGAHLVSSGSIVTSTGTVSAARIISSGSISTTTGTISGAHMVSSGSIVTSTGTISGALLNSTGNVTATGNISTTAGSISTSTGTISGAHLVSSGSIVTSTGTVSGAHLVSSGSIVTSTGTVSAASLNSTGNVTITGTVSAAALGGTLLGTATPLVSVAGGSVGISVIPSRQDHRHPINSDIAVPFSKAGVLSAGTGTLRWYNNSGRTLTINNVSASVNTAPTGTTLIVDVNVDGTTIYGTQTNRPIIGTGSFTALGGTKSITTMGTSSYITVDIDLVGTTVAGSDLAVSIWLS